MSNDKKGETLPKPITPAVHLEYIQNQAGLPETPSPEDVSEYHRAIFLHHHALEMEQLRQEAVLHEERLGFLDSRWKEIQGRLKGTEKFVAPENCEKTDLKPAAPWNAWDRAMFTGALISIIGLLVFGIFNISFNLLESGLVTFTENPVRAYFWAALLPVGAFGVKVGWDLLPTGKVRDVYLWCCLFLGMAGVLIWVGAYSTVYPTLSKSITDHLETLSVFGDPSAGGELNPAGVRRVDMVMVFAQAIAEIFLSAVLGMFMTLVYTRHRPVRLCTDPVYAQLDEERTRLEGEIKETRKGLATAKGRERQFESQVTALTAFAKSIYQKEITTRREQATQKEAILDQISRHVRTQLESIPAGDCGNRTAAIPAGGTNGK